MIGLGLLVPAHIVGTVAQAAQQMARDSCSGAGCHYGLINYSPWALVLLGISFGLGLVVLALPPRGFSWHLLRLLFVAVQWILLPLPALICGYP